MKSSANHTNMKSQKKVEHAIGAFDRKSNPVWGGEGVGMDSVKWWENVRACVHVCVCSPEAEGEQEPGHVDPVSNVSLLHL